ncbi:MAG: type II toxin-antitoxin system HicA family toxin [Chloroflexi bacterium]|nr:type II toxin-antitoxin system HicA family toxin [Chloroflexota bacterium]
MRRKHRRTLEAIFARPTSGNIRWADIESLFLALGAELEERAGSRIAVIFPGYPPAVFHRPHPSPKVDKGAIAAIRDWLDAMGYRP